MSGRLKKKLFLFCNRYWLTALTALITAAIGVMAIWATLERGKVISRIENEFDNFTNSLNAVGYDLAYDKLNFSYLSPWQVLRVDNLRIYSLDGSNYWEWICPELALSSGIWNADKIKLHLSRSQTIKHGLKTWNVSLPESENTLYLTKDGSLQSITIQAKDISAGRLFTAKQMSLVLQRAIPHQIKELSSAFNLITEAKDINIDDMTGWPLNKQIDHLYLEADIIGILEKQDIYSESVYNWVERGGNIEIRRMIINWKPLVLVGKGDLYFNEGLEPKLSLNTSSIALIETLDRLNQNQMLDDKGVFVAKILLNNKAFKKKGTDPYLTVTTPIRMNKEQVLIENIPIKNFIPEQASGINLKK